MQTTFFPADTAGARREDRFGNIGPAFVPAIDVGEGPQIGRARDLARRYRTQLGELFEQLRYVPAADGEERRPKFDRPRDLLLAATVKRLVDSLNASGDLRYGDIDNEFVRSHPGDGYRTRYDATLDRLVRKWGRKAQGDDKSGFGVVGAGHKLVEHLRSPAFLSELDEELGGVDESLPRYPPVRRLELAMELCEGLEHFPPGIAYMLESVATPKNASGGAPLPLLHDVRLEGFDALVANIDTIAAGHVKPGTRELDPEQLARTSVDKTLNAYLAYGSKVIPLLAAVAKKGELDEGLLGEAAFRFFTTLYKNLGFGPDDPRTVASVIAAVESRYASTEDIWFRAPPAVATSLLLVLGALNAYESVGAFFKSKDADRTAKLFSAVKDVADVLDTGIGLFGSLPANAAARDVLARIGSLVGFAGAVLGLVVGGFGVDDALDSPDPEKVIGPSLTVLAASISLFVRVGPGLIGLASPPAMMLGLLAFGIGLLATVATAAYAPSDDELLFRHCKFGVHYATRDTDEKGKPRKEPRNDSDPSTAHYRFYDRDPAHRSPERQLSAMFERMQLVSGTYHWKPLVGSTDPRRLLIMDLRFAVPVRSGTRVTVRRIDSNGNVRRAFTGDLFVQSPVHWPDADQLAPLDLNPLTAPRTQRREQWRPLAEAPVDLVGSTPGAADTYNAELAECVKEASPPGGDRRLSRLVWVQALDSEEEAQFGEHVEVRMELESPELALLQRHLLHAATGIPIQALDFSVPLTLFVRKEPSFLLENDDFSLDVPNGSSTSVAPRAAAPDTTRTEGTTDVR